MYNIYMCKSVNILSLCDERTTTVEHDNKENRGIIVLVNSRRGEN